MDDNFGPDPTDPIWSHLYETPSTSDSGSSEPPPHYPGDDVEVDPSEEWIRIDLPKTKKVWLPMAVEEHLRKNGIPAGVQKADNRSWVRVVLTRKIDLAVTVPRRFELQARRTTDDFLREQGIS